MGRGRKKGGGARKVVGITIGRLLCRLSLRVLFLSSVIKISVLHSFLFFFFSFFSFFLLPLFIEKRPTLSKKDEAKTFSFPRTRAYIPRSREIFDSHASRVRGWAAIYRRARSDSVFLLSLPFVRDRGGQTRYTSESKCISGVAA